MARLEKTEEDRFVFFVRLCKWKAIKLGTAGVYGEVGWNDRMVLASGGVIIFFEFKREGEEPTRIQQSRHRDLQNMGFQTHVVYTCDEAKAILLSAVRTEDLPTGVHKIRSVETRSRVSTRAGTGKDGHRSVHIQGAPKIKYRR